MNVSQQTLDARTFKRIYKLFHVDSRVVCVCVLFIDKMS